MITATATPIAPREEACGIAKILPTPIAPTVTSAVATMIAEPKMIFESTFVESLPVDVPAGDVRRQGDVLGRRQRRDKVEGLEDEPHLVAPELRERFVLQMGQVLVPDPDRAGGGLVEAGHAVEEGGFARARGAHDGRVLAGSELHGHTAECLDGGRAFAEDLPEIDGASGGGAGFREHVSSPSRSSSRGAYGTA